MSLKGLKTKTINKIILTILFLLIVKLPYAQKKSRAVLEKEKSENQKRIEEASKILTETKQKKKSTIGQLTAIKGRIQSRQKLINSIQDEICLLESEISHIENNIKQKDEEVRKLKNDYAKTVYVAYKHNHPINKLIYIFSAESVSQLSMRIKYFQHYSKARQQKLIDIENSIRDLEKEKQKLRKKLHEKNELVGIKLRETETLKEEHKEHEEVLKDLSKKEIQLRQELSERKKAQQKLENLITNLIAAERAKAIAESREKNKLNTKTKTTGSVSSTKESDYSLTLTPETKELSSLFSENEGKLPWPVQYGSIAQRFGRQPHPVLKGVFIDNLGVEIQTKKEEPIRTVFKGKVITVAEVPGMNKVVMVQHGEYFTVYAKLKTVNVHTGDEVEAKQKIGTVYTDKDDVSQLQFQIWKNNSKLDPENWLYSK